ncbi:MAG: hypothetical protein ACRDVM_00065 [Acidimicrobiia bacterium]
MRSGVPGEGSGPAEGIGGGWEPLAELDPGAVTSLAGSTQGTIAAGTAAGVYLSEDGGASWARAGQRLVPILTAAVAMASDLGGVLILAGAPDGALFRAAPGGAAWAQVDTGSARSAISAITLPDDFERSGVGFAGTVGDGVLRSGDRGHRWRAWNFGLLDLRVLALQAAPTFARNQTIFAGTPTGLYRSTNGGRAWQETDLPRRVGAILAIALSPDFDEDGTAYAGTEDGEVLVSRDHGVSWQALSGLGAPGALNALGVSPGFREDRRVVAVDPHSLYLSEDEGVTWSRRATFPQSVLALLLGPSFPKDGRCWLGLSEGGVLRSEAGSLDRWQTATGGLGGRLISGLRSSPAAAPALYAFGPWEGVYLGAGNGEGWSRSEGLPSHNVSDLQVAASPGDGWALYAALPEGIWRSGGVGGWERLADFPARAIGLSPQFGVDRTLAVARAEGGVALSGDGGRSWQELEVPFKGSILDVALAEADGRPRVVVVVDDLGEGGLSVWQEGEEGWWQLRVPQRGRRWGWLVPASGGPASLYACLSGRLYRLPLRAGRGRPRALPVGQRGEPITAAALWRDEAEVLAAATERGVQCSVDRGATWGAVGEGLPEPPVTALGWSEGPSRDPLLVAATLGDLVWRRRMVGFP